MRILIPFLIASVLATAATGALAQSGLPPCPGAFNAATWTDCLGTFTWRDDQKYIGAWKDGQPNGQGTTTFPDGAKYVGEYRGGRFHGQGSMAYPNGNQYTGEWKNGLANGHGTVTDRNGEKHTGEWKDGKLYAGEYKDGKPDGRGTMRLPNGRKYVGEFRDGKYNGKGTYTWPTGDKYVGEYKDDKRNGHGTYSYSDGDKYVGAFRDDKSHGQGTHTYANGNQYVGEWKNGSPNGQGTATYRNGEKHTGEWKDGRLYAGEYKNGKPDGRGTMRWPNGRKYVGEFRDGKYNGQGTYTSPSGDKYVGTFRDDKFHGQGTYTHADGTKDAGEWKDGKSTTSVRSREPAHQVIAKAVGLRPIGERPSPAGDELRLWVFTHRVTQPMYLLREGPAAVSGEFVLWWGQVYGRWYDDPTGQAYDMSAIIRQTNEERRKIVKTRWNCAKTAVAALFDACRTSFKRQPDWSRLLRALEREGVWDLPDGSTLPRAAILDGVVLLVEVRRGGKTRSYSYSNPSLIPGPEGRSADRILTLLGEFENMLQSWR